MEREPEARESVMPTRVVIELRSPAPIQTPVPSSTPATVQHVAAPRATMPAVHTGGSKGAPKLQVRTQQIVHHKESRPIWWSAMHGSKTVASTGTGTQPSLGPGASSGSGTGAGSGAGSESNAGGGTGGNGSGVANETAPCGSPVFYRIHAQFNRQDGSFDDTIRVQLTLGDGQRLEGVFPYAWHYASEADDPFSQKTSDDDEGVKAQLPPPGLNSSKEPLAVRLTLEKTRPDGRTDFDPCPPGVGKDL